MRDTTMKRPRIPLLLLPVLCLLASAVVLVSGQPANRAQIPADLLAKALNHVAKSPPTYPNAEATIEALQGGSVEALYQVANSMNKLGGDDRLTSIQIYHALADDPSSHHIMSMVQLGFTYSESNKSDAIKYFVQAGEDGPHQAALYNAGRLFLESNDYARALGYIRAAATLAKDKNTAMYAKPQMTETAEGAYRELCKMLIGAIDNLSLQDMVDAFPYASILDFPKEGSKEDKIWHNAMTKLAAFTSSKSRDANTLEGLRTELAKLLEGENKKMSELQKVLLIGIMAETYKTGTEEL